MQSLPGRTWAAGAAGLSTVCGRAGNPARIVPVSAARASAIATATVRSTSPTWSSASTSPSACGPCRHAPRSTTAAASHHRRAGHGSEQLASTDVRATPTATRTNTAAVTATATVSATATTTATLSPTGTQTATPTGTASATVTDTPGPSATPTETLTPSMTPTPTEAPFLDARVEIGTDRRLRQRVRRRAGQPGQRHALDLRRRDQPAPRRGAGRQPAGRGRHSAE